MKKIELKEIEKIIKPRPSDMHKGQAGRVLIIAGSKGMAGAAVLAARGCLYSGAGLLKVAVPDELFNILQISVPEAMCVERNNLCACRSGSGNNALDYDAIAIGPGIGIYEENIKCLELLLSAYEGPLIIDADGINCLCKYGNVERLRDRNGVTVLTPHPGEADRILRAIGADNAKDREETVRIIASQTGAITLLKGEGTLIASPDPDETVYINTTGNPGMATGGSGDVLTGMMASLMAQKHLDAVAIERVKAAAFIHGLAGDIAAENVGEYGMTAADIADAVSVAFKGILL